MHSLATPKPLEVFVNGFDVSAHVLEINGSYDQYSDGSGLILMTGELRLGELPGVQLDLDDRTNSLWSLGNLVTISTGGSRSPIVGTSYIDSVQYSIPDRVLTLGLVCRLGLLNNANPGENGVCFPLSQRESLSATSAVQRLLNKAGVGAVSIPPLGGTLYEIQWLDPGESFISKAGSIAAETGHYIYQDRFGTVRVEPITAYDVGNVVASYPSPEELPVYERLFSAELPPDVISAQGDICDFLPERDPTETLNISATPLGYQYTTTKEEKNRESRIITNTTTITMPRGDSSPEIAPGNTSPILHEKTVVTQYYETEKRKVGVDENNCVPLDPGRLLRETTITTGWNKSIIAGWIKARKTAEERSKNKLGEAIFFDSQILKRSQTDEWTYNIPPAKLIRNSDTNFIVGQSEYVVTHTRTVVEPLGAVLPDLGNPYWGLKGTPFLQPEAVRNPYTPITTEIFKETWKLASDKKTWIYESNLQQIAARIRPQLIQDLEFDVKTQNKESILLRLGSKETGTENNTQYRTGGQWSPDSQVDCTPYNLKQRLAAPNPLQKNRTFSLGNKLNSISQANAIALALGKLEWGRYRGQNITIGLGTLSNPGLRPFSRITVGNSTYAVDGASIIIRPNEGAIQSDCVWISTGNIVPIQPAVDVSLYHDTEYLNTFSGVAFGTPQVEAFLYHDTEAWEPLPIVDVLTFTAPCAIILETTSEPLLLESGVPNVLLPEDECL